MANDDFRLLAKFYDKLIKTDGNITWKKLIQDKKFDNILDVGGGTGRLTQFLVDCANKIYICDFSFPMLRAAKSKGMFQEICCSIESAPFIKSTFDCILMIDAFHHLIDQISAVKQILTLLKPGGIFILEEPDIDHWQVKLIAIGEKLLFMRSHFQKSETLEAWINKDEFSVDVYKEKLNFHLVITKR